MTDIKCEKCNKALCADEIALFRKIFNRAATSFWCLDCQAKYVDSTREKLQKVIDYYHETGICTLFAKYEE